MSRWEAAAPGLPALPLNVLGSWDCAVAVHGMHIARPGEGTCMACGREFRDEDPEVEK